MKISSLSLTHTVQTGANEDQRFEFLLNNFARLTNIVSEECPTFALFKSVFRLHLLYVVFKLCALKVKGLENFQAFAFCLKLRVNKGYVKIFNSLHNCIGTLRLLITETISDLNQKAFEASFV